jgi:hypothetical protein
MQCQCLLEGKDVSIDFRNAADDQRLAADQRNASRESCHGLCLCADRAFQFIVEMLHRISNFQAMTKLIREMALVGAPKYQSPRTMSEMLCPLQLYERIYEADPHLLSQ